jgi:methylthioribulose-1-phosphate dehydratase
MAITFDQLPVCDALANIAHDLHRRGWMAGTAGNLSSRDRSDLNSFWVTASGKPKGQLEATDFLRINIEDGAELESRAPGNKPSAETSIHQVIYRLFPEAKACLHVHTIEACLATQYAGEGLHLPKLEMLKGMGIWEEEPDITLPLFENWLEVPRIAEEIETRFCRESPQISALMIRNHGLTIWGESLQQAYNRLEIMEFIMGFMARSD